MITRKDVSRCRFNNLLEATRSNGIPDSLFFLVSSDRRYAIEKLDGSPHCVVAFTSKRVALEYVEHIPADVASGWKAIEIDVNEIIPTIGLINDQLIIVIYSSLFETYATLDFQMELST